jgi:hypothetical protein
MRRILLPTLFLFATAAFAGISGDYEGTYKSSDGSITGKMHTTLMKKDDASWDCKWSFTYGGEEIAATPVSCAIDAEKMIAEYDADVEGNAVRVKLEGAADAENQIAGTYKASDQSGNVVGEGKWTVSLKR